MSRTCAVLVFTAGDHRTASSKYRAFLLGKYLTEQRSDIEWRIVEPATKMLSSLSYPAQVRESMRQARLLFWRPRHDVVFIQRAIYNKFVFLALLVQNILRIRPSIFDFDDAIFLHSPFKTRMMCKMSSAVIVGSHHLAVYARRYNTNVTLIPTCIRFSDYADIERKARTSDTVTIGWLGGAGAYVPELHALSEVLRALHTKGIQFHFLLVGAFHIAAVHTLFEFLPKDTSEIIDYVDAPTDADLIPYLSRMDIGLMPLSDNEWNRGKCALKAIQYMASGAATIASPVGENRVVIKDGTNGMLASGQDEWGSCLRELIEDPTLRQRLGVEARAHVRSQYSYETQCPRVADLIGAVLEWNSN